MEHITRQEIGKGIPLHWIDSPKFKTVLLGIAIRTQLKKETAAVHSLLVRVLKSGCERYPTPPDMAVKNEKMWGSVFDGYILKKGEEQILFFYFECLPEILPEGCSFLRKILYHPRVSQGGFLPEVVEREKERLIEDKKGDKDDKKQYAKKRLIEEMFQGEPFGLDGDGEIEDLEKIDPVELYAQYRHVMASAPIEVIFCGGPNDKATEAITGIFEGPRHTLAIPSATWKHPWKEDVKIVEEQMDVSQCKLGIGFSSTLGQEEFYSLLVWNEMFGGGGGSRLFQSVREKEGLCYSIYSYLLRFKMAVIVQAGIEESSIQKTLEGVKSALHDMIQSKFEKEEIKNAKLSLMNYYATLGDNQTGTSDFYFTEYLMGRQDTLASYQNKIKSVTRDQIINAAKSLRMDTVYILKGETKHDSLPRE